MAINQTIQSKKIILIGDGGSGKTSFVTRFKDGNFRREYIATIGAVTHPVVLTTTHGNINVIIWDTAGQEMNAGLLEAYYIDTDVAVVFFDLTSRATLRHVNLWSRKVKSTCPNVPIIVVGNKIDVKDRKALHVEIRQKIPRGCDYVEISAKTNFNFDILLSKIVDLLTGHHNIRYIPAIDLEPAQLTIDRPEIQQSSERMDLVQLAMNLTLDDEDEHKMEE